MASKIQERLYKDPKIKELLQLLTKRLSNSEMQSLLIEAFRSRSLVRTEARHYYAHLAFRIRFWDPEGRIWDLVDGGFTNWTQWLLNSRKERSLQVPLDQNYCSGYLRVPLN